jgi:hypothetical protein
MMDLPAIIESAAAALAALGGGGLIVGSFSGFFGKLWADKMMAADRAAHEKQLEELRADLLRKNADELERLKAEIDLQKDKLAGAHQDKLTIYRAVIDLVIDAVLEAELARAGVGQTSIEKWMRFEALRLRAYGQLAMLAPQPVMDAYAALTDYFLDVKEAKHEYSFGRVRELGLALLNEVRRDLTIDPTPIAYRGTRQ